MSEQGASPVGSGEAARASGRASPSDAGIDEAVSLGTGRDEAGTVTDQEDYERLVKYLYAKVEDRLSAHLDAQLQNEVGILLRLLERMPRPTLDRCRVYFELAFDLAAAEKPNLLLIKSLRVNLTNVDGRAHRGLLSFVPRLCGGSPLHAALTAFVSIFVFLFVIIAALVAGHFLLRYLGGQIQGAQPVLDFLERFPLPHLVLLIFSSFLGSIVSILTRIRDFINVSSYSALQLYVSVLSKPFVAAAFALFAYAVMKAGLVAFVDVNLDGPTGPYVVWIIGFLSGFSERFAQDFITAAEGRLERPDTPAIKRGVQAPDHQAS